MHESSRLFASGSRDRTVKLWSLDIHQGIENWESEPFSECLMTYNGHRRTAVTDVHFLGGGGISGISDMVASCDGQVHVSLSPSSWRIAWNQLVVNSYGFLGFSSAMGA